MKTILDLLDSDKEQDHYIFLSEEEQKVILDEILIFANNNKSTLIQYCHKIIPTQFCNLELIYEALAKDPVNWGEFICEEFKRIFSSASKSNDPFDYTYCLDVALFFEETNNPLGDKIINILLKELDNPIDALRHRAVWFLSDWIDEEDITKYKFAIDKMLTRLKDSNWKVRYITYFVLKEKLPASDNRLKINSWDKLRGKYLMSFFSSPFIMTKE
jgi:hypothetical protein